jgi:programmed cell death protein 4
MMEHEVLNGHETDIVPEEGQNGVANDVSGTAGAEGVNSTDCVSVENRIKRKAKRLIKQLSKEGVTNGTTVVQGTRLPRLRKNSRRPRNGFGRGLPKKGRCNSITLWWHNKYAMMSDQNTKMQLGLRHMERVFCILLICVYSTPV